MKHGEAYDCRRSHGTRSPKLVKSSPQEWDCGEAGRQTKTSFSYQQTSQSLEILGAEQDWIKSATTWTKGLWKTPHRGERGPFWIAGPDWLTPQIKDSDWLLVWVKNGVIGIFLIGKYPWEIREFSRAASPLRNLWAQLEAARGFHMTTPSHSLNSGPGGDSRRAVGRAAGRGTMASVKGFVALLLALLTLCMSGDSKDKSFFLFRFSGKEPQGGNMQGKIVSHARCSGPGGSLIICTSYSDTKFTHIQHTVFHIVPGDKPHCNFCCAIFL